jgi:uncharacterized membrane protein
MGFALNVQGVTMWEYEHSVETTARPEALWRHWSDLRAWPQWNKGIEKLAEG